MVDNSGSGGQRQGGTGSSSNRRRYWRRRPANGGAQGETTGSAPAGSQQGGGNPRPQGGNGSQGQQANAGNRGGQGQQPQRQSGQSQQGPSQGKGSQGGQQQGQARNPNGGGQGRNQGGNRQGGNRNAPVAPGVAPKGKLRIIPLGGVGEIGKNMTAYEYEQDMILVDAGAMFPEEDMGGIDLVVPDVAYVRDKVRNLRAIVITHGHEDHIGGIPHVIRLLNAPQPITIYGPPLAIGLIEQKILEYRLDKRVKLVPVTRERVNLGRFSIEWIPVTHSIPDTCALAIRTPVGTVVQTSDFKFDPTPVMGPPTDESRLRRLGDEGVLVLISDTTRSESKGWTPSEQIVYETMNELISKATGQVIVTTFASNISRIQMSLQVAQNTGRKVAVAGRSLEQSTRVAKELGYLNPPEGLMLPLEQVLRLPRDQRLLYVTGSQGEPQAALARIAVNDHKQIRISAGDTVILSSSPVPGNELSVTRNIDNLFRRGANVVYSAVEPRVHVSGHGSRDELRHMLDLTRPRYAVPVHGEFRHLSLFRDIAGEAGVPFDRVLIPELGSVLEFTEQSGTFRGKVESGSILVDKLSSEGGPANTKLRDADHLTDEGLVVVSVVMSRNSSELLVGPEIMTRNLGPELNDAVMTEAEAELRKFYGRLPKGELEYGFVVRKTKEIVAKTLYRRTKARPLIVPVVTPL